MTDHQFAVVTWRRRGRPGDRGVNPDVVRYRASDGTISVPDGVDLHICAPVLLGTFPDQVTAGVFLLCHVGAIPAEPTVDHVNYVARLIGDGRAE